MTKDRSLTGNIEEAREFARSFLVFLTEDPERLGRFLSITGVGPAEIRTRMREDVFLGGLLDYLLSDEEMVIAFSQAQEVPTETPGRLRYALPGGATEESL